MGTHGHVMKDQGRAGRYAQRLNGDVLSPGPPSERRGRFAACTATMLDARSAPATRSGHHLPTTLFGSIVEQ